jgi:hypothetical protein
MSLSQSIATALRGSVRIHQRGGGKRPGGNTTCLYGDRISCGGLAMKTTAGGGALAEIPGTRETGCGIGEEDDPVLRKRT